MNKQTCKSAGANPAGKNSARRYLFSLSPAGADLVLLLAIEVMLWIA